MRESSRYPLVVFVACLIIYHLNGRPQPQVDCVAAPYTAWSIVRHASLDLSCYPELRYLVGATNLRELPDGRCLSMRPPGSALAALPFVAPIALVQERPLGVTNMFHLGKLAAACCVAAAAAVFFALCRRLTPESAWPATVLFALGTSLWSVASQSLWMHGPATLALTSALYFLLADEEMSSRPAGVAGLLLGLAILCRPTAVFFAGAAGLVLVARRRWRCAAAMALGGAVPVGALCLFGLCYFGHPLLGGYAQEYWNKPTPLWLGVSGLLVAPSRGVFVYSPALVFVPLGVWAARRLPAARRLMTYALFGATALTVFFYGGWDDWRGGYSFGPRFLCETMPVACWLFALAHSCLVQVWPKRMALALVGISVAIQFLGVFGHGADAAWHDRHYRLDDQGRCLFSFQDTEIRAHALEILRRVTQ